MTSGGIVLDKEIIFSAISSDTIAAYLAKTLEASKLILLTDVDGVYNRDSPGKLINNLSLTRVRWKDYQFIIGDMEAKIRRISSAVDAGIETYIANGNNLTDVINVIDERNSSQYTPRCTINIV